MPHRSEIQIRDPYIVVHDGYWMFGTTDPDPWRSPGVGFNAYRSRDLERFDGPREVFSPPAGFWGTHNLWAPEVHRYADAWYMFASFTAEGHRRGTQILRAQAIEGPFLPITEEPATPTQWECLDGTLWVEDGHPWIVFCHEWTQTGVGTVCARKLTPDLSRPAAGSDGEPLTLFAGNDASWARPINDDGAFVTDGPFLYRTSNGTLLMIWSGFGEGGYTVGLARSTTGSVRGPWVQLDHPLYPADGGHGMIFRTIEGELKLALHSPNDTPNERPLFVPVAERGDTLELELREKRP